ncbi:MAG TPA: hypothetical protein VGZ02_05540 [Candidatus Baltobacteraceae bacterium]|jgi:cytochrome P450|nr:hypothetical protein [Candidatus Baltobacteraceae bacterium]
MERAWIVSKDDEVEAVLACTSLHVRPPGRQVPERMDGTTLGSIFERLVRMNDGERHAALRAIVERQIAAWDIAQIVKLAVTSAKRMPAADVPAFVMATIVGLRDPLDALPRIHEFAAAIAGGATEDDIARGIAAAEYLAERIPLIADPDEKANLLGFLFQTSAATAALVEHRRHRHMTPPVVLTRRWAACDLEICNTHLRQGDAVIVLLTSPKFHFGAGPHRCPGRQVAELIAEAVIEAAPPATFSRPSRG